MALRAVLAAAVISLAASGAASVPEAPSTGEAVASAAASHPADQLRGRLITPRMDMVRAVTDPVDPVAEELRETLAEPLPALKAVEVPAELGKADGALEAEFGVLAAAEGRLDARRRNAYDRVVVLRRRLRRLETILRVEADEEQDAPDAQRVRDNLVGGSLRELERALRGVESTVRVRFDHGLPPVEYDLKLPREHEDRIPDVMNPHVPAGGTLDLQPAADGEADREPAPAKLVRPRKAESLFAE